MSLTDLTRPERLSPVRRWRYRLLASGLDPATAPPSITGEPRAFVDAVLEALASQYEARWTVALGLLAKSDPRLAQQLALRLCSTVRFTDATVAPVWETDQSELEDLLADLLDPAVGAEGHARRAQVWLDRQPPAVVWPIDPEGDSAGSARLPIATIGIANLSGSPLLASSVWLDQVGHEIGPRPELASLAPHAWAELKAATPKDAVATSRSAQGDDVHSATLAIHCGESEQRLTIPVDPLSAAPPSLALGPLLGDLMLETFQSGSRGVPIEPAWSTTALLYRGPVDGSSPDGAVRTGGWTLYVQCSRAEDPARAADLSPAADSIRIIAGPRSSPRMILRIDETGRVEREDDRGNTGASVPARVSREPSRWLALVQIPPDAIEDDGILRIGLERFDARGVHSAWPRASLPWQEIPARAVINLAAWER